MTELSLIAKARSRLLVKHVFFATLVLNTPLIADDAVGTAATDFKQIIYSPKFLETVGKGNVDFAMFVLAHEVCHIMWLHGLRRGNRDPERWNVAADHAINLWLKKCGFTVWDKCYCDPQYEGMSAEQIYEKLPKNGGSGSEGKSGNGTKPCKGDGTDPGGLGHDIRYVEISEAQKRTIERDVRGLVAQAVNVARIAGKLSADIERVVRGIIDPPLPWEDLLRNYATRVVQEEESWSRRNRRMIDYFAPARYALAMGELVVVTDTSGSIGDDLLAQVAHELTYIRDTVKPERTRVIYVDAKVKGEQIFEGDEDIVLKPKGGGGTNMCVGLTHAAQFDPVCCVLVTDGYTPWPTTEPDFPLIVAVSTNQPVPIGEVVRMRPR